jgi:cytochrome c556
MRKGPAIAAAVLALGAAGVAWAAVDAAAVEAARETHFKEIGRNNKAIRDQLKTDAPDLAVIGPAAHRIAELSVELPSWFPAGSGPRAGIKTEARPEIWAKLAEFKTKAANLGTRARAVEAAAGKGDKAAVAQAANELGQACKSCHEEFRHEDH